MTEPLQEILDLATYSPDVIDHDDRPLREKNLDEVLKGFNGDPFYSRGINIESDPEKTVHENFAIIEGIQQLFQALSNITQTGYNDLLRVTVIHGFSLYELEIGNDIAISFRNRTEDILSRKSSSFGSVQCNINLEECEGKHTSFGLDKTISGALGKHARMGCIPKYKLITICMCYSLTTYPNLEHSQWNDIFTTNIQKFEKKQRERMGMP